MLLLLKVLYMLKPALRAVLLLGSMPECLSRLVVVKGLCIIAKMCT